MPADNSTPEFPNASEDAQNEDANFDKYGNPKDGSELINCCFPDCGCDGARLCMAKNGASHDACKCNVEGMYQRTDRKARIAKIGLIGLCINRSDKDSD